MNDNEKHNDSKFVEKKNSLQKIAEENNSKSLSEKQNSKNSNEIQNFDSRRNSKKISLLIDSNKKFSKEIIIENNEIKEIKENEEIIKKNNRKNSLLRKLFETQKYYKNETKNLKKFEIESNLKFNEILLKFQSKINFY